MKAATAIMTSFLNSRRVAQFPSPMGIAWRHILLSVSLASLFFSSILLPSEAMNWDGIQNNNNKRAISNQLSLICNVSRWFPGGSVGRDQLAMAAKVRRHWFNPCRLGSPLVVRQMGERIAHLMVKA